MGIYFYNVRWYSEVDGEYINSSGLVSGDSIGEATNRLETEYFKNEDISYITIHVLEGSTEGFISLADLKDFIQENDPDD